ncbi:MAG: ion channel, partial [Actinomycetota bacterium]|nr:ion channel [Actinomycetota bacterium]
MNAPTVIVVLLGAFLILFTLRDVFHEVLHPSGAGSLSGMLVRSVWRSIRRLTGRPGLLSMAGPLSVVAIVGWAAVLAVGWALVYWPYLPGRFLFQTGLNPRAQDGFVDALYYSLVTLLTLGYGDIVPTNEVLRVLAPVETLIGFGLLTGGLTWVLSIYPALTRRRSLAQQVMVLHEAESESGIDVVESHPETAEQIFRDLGSQLLTVRSDLQQFHVTYFFHSTDERSALASVLLYLARLAERGREEGRPPEVRLSATVLRRSLDDFAQTVASSFLGLPPDTATEEVLAAYARDH